MTGCISRHENKALAQEHTAYTELPVRRFACSRSWIAQKRRLVHRAAQLALNGQGSPRANRSATQPGTTASLQNQKRLGVLIVPKWQYTGDPLLHLTSLGKCGGCANLCVCWNHFCIASRPVLRGMDLRSPAEQPPASGKSLTSRS